MTTIPTLEDMNKYSGAQTCLIMLRALNTSDLTSMYMLFKQSSIADFVEQARSIYEIEAEAISNLTPDETVEYHELLNDLRHYVDFQEESAASA